MTGPEHYARAEALLGGRNNPGANGANSQEEALALAQVHATLALAAATVSAAAHPNQAQVDYLSRWLEVTSDG